MWISAATAAAVRLAAEAGDDVDDLLGHDTAPGTLAFHVTRLEQSAELGEVAADLAGMLWAECADVPRITTLHEEPAAQAALEAVSEARRQAAARLAGRVEPIQPIDPAPMVTLFVTPPPPPPPPPVTPPVPAPPVAVSVAAPSAQDSPRRCPRVPVLAGSAAAAVLLFSRRLRRA